jgi:sugar O-acyltransferase (sialic acid O-acetyltransferase NeuD family)
MNSSVSPLRLVIIGAGGFGREAKWVVDRRNALPGSAGALQLLGFCDDNASRKGNLVSGRPILGRVEDVAVELGAPVAFFCAIGGNKARQTVVGRALACGWTPLALIDPDAVIAPDAKIGAGCYVGPGAIVSVDATVGAHAILNHDCQVGHDAVLEDFTQVSPGGRVSGGSCLKTGAFLGANAVIYQGKTLGAFAVLGATSFAVANVPDGATAMGNPARVLFGAKA